MALKENLFNGMPEEISVGVDLEEISRFRELDSNSPFFERVFSEHELSYCRSYEDPIPHLTANFSGKEAVRKTLGTDASLSLWSIEILRTKDGVPHVRINGRDRQDIALSLSHSSHYAIAFAMKSSSPASTKMMQAELDRMAIHVLPE
jgi:phosphopantetheine--protein transferase-like protein